MEEYLRDHMTDERTDVLSAWLVGAAFLLALGILSWTGAVATYTSTRSPECVTVQESGLTGMHESPCS